MRTTTPGELSNFHITINDSIPASSNQELMRAMVRAARKTDWDVIITKMDRAISIAGAAAVIVTILYFAPILVSILTVNP
jgi:adenine/guanine phosphoribosyltransferase-like PRPP-binding protein